MYSALFPYLLGVLMAWITWSPARRLSPRSQRHFFTAVITAVSVGFVGFPLETGDWPAFLWELAALIVFVLLIFLSRSWTVAFLPVVWFAHGAWDLAYLVGAVPVDKPDWVVKLCVPYDWLLALYLLGRVSTWRRAETQ